jgi:molybdopterin-guanine dinucleotide biosynthesis protein A
MGRVAVIFAGGKSSRMGRDKSLLPFGGYSSLCEYQYRRLLPLFDKVYISTKEDKFEFEAPLIYDRYPQSSPLVALISIFETLSVDELFVLSVDSPSIGGDIIDRLYNLSSTHSTIAKSPKGREPLCGIYRRTILPFAKALLDEDNHRLNTLLDISNSAFVEFDSQESFSNLNYIDEYKEAIKNS